LETLNALDENPAWIAEGTTVIVQIDPKERETSLFFEHLDFYDERRYGKTALLFFMRKSLDTENVSEEETIDG
jgi:16S rRNA G966 N2-methylase RsmD